MQVDVETMIKIFWKRPKGYTQVGTNLMRDELIKYINELVDENEKLKKEKPQEAE